MKVRTTEEQKLLKQKEQQKKLAAYRYAMNQIASTRKNVPYDKTSFQLCAQVLTVNPDVYTLWNYRKEVVLQQIEMRYFFKLFIAYRSVYSDRYTTSYNIMGTVRYISM